MSPLKYCFTRDKGCLNYQDQYLTYLSKSVCLSLSHSPDTTIIYSYICVYILCWSKGVFFFFCKMALVVLQFSSVQSLSRVQLFATPWIAACQASLSITNSESTQTHIHWVGDAIQPSHPLSSPPPVPNPSQHQGLFQWVKSSHEVAKVLKFQL